jgi:hypothetical protein
MTRALNYYDVFVPGGYPQHTYNPRRTLNLEERLTESRQNLCKLVAVTGHTKSGKTVLTRRVLPPEEAVWIDGGTVSEERDFWDGVVEQLDLFQQTQQSTAEDVTSTIGGKASGGADFLIVKGTGELSTARAEKRGTGTTSSRSITSRITALNGLRDARTPLVIDDFHYLPKDLQGNIVRALKPLIFDGLPVVVIAIPHRRYDSVKVEKEMTGRIRTIDVPVWSEEELCFIPETGFALLNQKVPAEIEGLLAKEAIGSPFLMQDFCRAVSKPTTPNGVASASLTLNQADLESVYREVAESIGRPIFEKLARGPRQRSDRLPRSLKDGSTVDIYQLVLHALAHLKPGLVSLEYEDLRAAIKDVSASDIPQLHEVARVLKHMATIAASDKSSTPVIDFEEEEKKLHVTDPFFAFFLRWGNLSE